MNYATTLALFLGVASAGVISGTSSCSSNNYGPLPESTERSWGRPEQYNLGEQLIPGLNPQYGGELHLAQGYLKDAQNLHNEDYAKLPYEGFRDAKQDSILCIKDNEYDNLADGIVRGDASRVQAAYQGCSIGETYVPAVKQTTKSKTSACYNSDSAGAYELNGGAHNNYSLCGSLTSKQCITQQGSDVEESDLSLYGSKTKKWCQSGNKALGGCADGSDCSSLDGVLLDEQAAEVTSNPGARVQDEVNEAIQEAISKCISDAVNHCISESLKGMIKV
jgi:hypothetical protein